MTMTIDSINVFISAALLKPGEERRGEELCLTFGSTCWAKAMEIALKHIKRRLNEFSVIIDRKKEVVTLTKIGSDDLSDKTKFYIEDEKLWTSPEDLSTNRKFKCSYKSKQGVINYAP